MFIYRGGFAPHDLAKAFAGCRDRAPPGRLGSHCLAAALPRSLLTVTPSAVLHHITKRLMLFPADRMASPKQPPTGEPGLDQMHHRGLLKCFPQQIPRSTLQLLSVCFQTLFDILLDYLSIISSEVL